MKTCNGCGVELNSKNWSSCYVGIRNYRCKLCESKRQRFARLAKSGLHSDNKYCGCGEVIDNYPRDDNHIRCKSCQRDHALMLRRICKRKRTGLIRGHHLRSDANGRECKECGEYKEYSNFRVKGGRYKNGYPCVITTCKACLATEFYPVKRKVNYTKKINRHASKRSPSSLVSWRDNKAIKKIYFRRDELSYETKIEHHVDHIVPLRGMINGIRLVSGLHWEGNLDVVKAKENLDKGGTWWPDMPNYTESDIMEISNENG